MEQTAIQQLVKAQRDFFNTDQTKDRAFRKKQLNTLAKSLMKHEEDFYWAFEKDLGKPKMEVYTTEFALVLQEIKTLIKNLEDWTKVETVPRSVASFLNKSELYREPYGLVYIIGPFNYPLQLTLVPLAGALAAGNCAIVKPSSKTPNVAAVIRTVIHEAFPADYVRVLSPNFATNEEVLKERFDLIFFTGSPKTGKIIMEAAAKHLTPVVLELGGKSPAIITEDCDLDKAAEKIIWSKLLNTGQTCIATDYVLVPDALAEFFIILCCEKIQEFYGDNIRENPDYGRVISDSAWDRLDHLIKDNEYLIRYGGNRDRKTRFIEPTIFEIPLSREISLMKEELFGPLLPICHYQTIDQAIEFIKAGEKPLALYLFSENKKLQQRFMNQISFGGGGINQTILHVANEHLPFGGVGYSGIGHYHGKYSIDAFSHQKGIVYGRNDDTSRLIFPPYNDQKLNWIKKLLH